MSISNPLFFANFGQKFDKSSKPAELNWRSDACNSAKLPQYNLFEMSEHFFKISTPKKSKNRFFGPKIEENDKKNQKISEFFFDPNRFRMVQNVFQNDNLEFFSLKIFSGT